jgi:hypothetical protein
MAEEKNRMMGPKAKQPGLTPTQKKGGSATRKEKPIIIMMDGKEYQIVPGYGDGDIQKIGDQKMSKGGRASFKSGMKVCKLAKKGKGKAYGKNS